MSDGDRRTYERHRPARHGAIPGTARDAPVEPKAWVQLATRVPKALHRRVKLHCIERDLSVMGFVVDALSEKLGRDETGRRR